MRIAQSNSISINLSTANGSAIQITNKLVELLHSYSAVIRNLKACQQRFKEDKLFNKQLKIKALIENLQFEMDRLNRRLLFLGGKSVEKISTPISRSSRLASDSFAALEEVVDQTKVLIDHQRGIVDFANNANDRITSDLITEHIKSQSKQVWSISYFLFLNLEKMKLA